MNLKFYNLTYFSMMKETAANQELSEFSTGCASSKDLSSTIQETRKSQQCPLHIGWALNLFPPPHF